MHQNPENELLGRKRPAAVYFFAGMAAFCVMFVVIVLRNGEVGHGPSHNAVFCSANDNPLVFWGSVIAVALVCLAMIALCIRSEFRFRENRKVMNELEDK